ncbi:ROK family protein [Nocardia sp. CNY236]|uniref:ROK family protein n=1 Tax=Nocardia sp. CNY236 TaxID=1169152 RepID=UPI00041C0BB5|nr:ROK family protein [Nocardia sp. CNY236]
MVQEVVLAVDIGGTKISAGLVGPDRKVRRHIVISTPANEPDIGDALQGLLTSVTDYTRPAAIGVASAGPVDPQHGTVSPINIPAWRNFPLVDLVSATVPELPVTLVGDAIAAAVGEHWVGAGRGATAMLGIVVSTGVGGGLVLDGAPYPGPSGNAGHLGHIVVDPAGPRCSCGATGCVETYASGPSMARWAREHGWSGPDARALAADAAGGNTVAQRAYDRGAEALARAITTAATLCDLDRVVIGGGVSGAGRVLFAPLQRHLDRLSTSDFAGRTTVYPAALGGHAGLLGAAHNALSAARTAPRPSDILLR